MVCPWNSPGKNTGVGCPFPSPGNLPNPGIEPVSPSLQANFLPSVLPGKPQSHQKTILFQTSRSRGLKLAISWNNRKQRRRKEIKNTCCTFWLVMKFKSWSSHIQKRTFYGWARDLESYLCVCVLVAQWCPTLCDPMDCGPPGSSVHGILQARILQWVAIAFSRETSLHRAPTLVSCRQIIYHLSHQGNPSYTEENIL